MTRPSRREQRHARIEVAVVAELARLIKDLAPDAESCLQVQVTDEQDTPVFRLGADDRQLDLVVWNRDLVTLKNAIPALHEVRRILSPGGLFLLTVPNLAALHNRFLLLAGRQPTTLHIANGDHVRGFASTSMTAALRDDLGFAIERVTGVGLAPVTGATLPRSLTGIAHTVIWALRRPPD